MIERLLPVCIAANGAAQPFLKSRRSLSLLLTMHFHLWSDRDFDTLNYEAVERQSPLHFYGRRTSYRLRDLASSLQHCGGKICLKVLLEGRGIFFGVLINLWFLRSSGKTLPVFSPASKAIHAVPETSPHSFTAADDALSWSREWKTTITWVSTWWSLENLVNWFIACASI